MKTKLHLFNVNFDIDLMRDNDLIVIAAKVKEDFAMFTEGTSKEYRSADKLRYIDNIRNRLYITDFDEYVIDYVKGTIDYQQDVGIFEDDKLEIEWGYDFAETVFRDSQRNFYKGGEKPILYDNLVTIIKAVMEYEE